MQAPPHKDMHCQDSDDELNSACMFMLELDAGPGTPIIFSLQVYLDGWLPMLLAHAMRALFVRCSPTNGLSVYTGIGRAVVEELAHLGAVVVTCARHSKKLDAALAEWEAQGLRVYGCVADVSKPEDRDTLMALANKQFDGACSSTACAACCVRATSACSK